MSRIRNCLTIATGAAAGLFLAALGSSATASADTAPVNPGLPGLVEQVFGSSAGIPQQLLQSTTSALTGAPLTPAASPAQEPIASATLNLPQAPASAAPAGVPGLPGLSAPGSLSSVLPFPLPNFGGTTAPVVAPAPTLPGVFVPPAPAVPSVPTTAQLIPGLP